MFRHLVVAFAVSLVGDGVRMVALPLTAALITGSPLALAAVAAAELVPWLLLGMPVGAWVDRSNPRAALLLAHLGRAVLSAVLVGALVTGHAGVTALCALAFTLTALETVGDAAGQVLLVKAAGPDDLLPANTRMRSLETLLVNLAGPLVGGALVAVDPHLGLAFMLDAVTFLLAAGAVAVLPSWVGRADGGDASAVSSLRHAVLEGVVLLWRTPALRLLVGITLWTSLATGAVNAMMSLYALDVLGLPVAAVPVITIVEAVGVLLGAQLVGRVRAWRSEGAVLSTALFLVGGAYLVVGLAPSTAVVLACYFAGGAGFGWWNVLASTRRQRLTPPELLGRTSNAGRALTWGAMPLGALLGGLLASSVSLPSVYIAAGSLVLAVALFKRRALLDEASPTANLAASAPA
ncbi:MAG: MFS transporter [Mycobacteriaceae bacterium]